MVQSLKGYALIGMIWGSFGAVVGKSAGFISQIVLGLLLSKEDFALYAVAVTISGFVSCLNNGGTHRILIQRAADFDCYAWGVFKLSLLFNCLVFIIMFIMANIVSQQYDAPELKVMLVIMGASTLIATPSYILQAKLLGDLKFKVNQILAICSHLLRHGATIIFAFFGFGVMSFVLPLVFNALVDNVLAWLAVRQMPPTKNLTKNTTKNLLSDSKWIMLSTFSMALIQNGDNLAISFIVNKETLGIYFFAFQLTFSLSALLGGTLQSVLMPTFSNVSGNQSRQRSAFIRSVHVMALVVSFFILALVPLAQLIISSIWSGKWDEAIPVVQVLSFCLPFVVLSSIARAAIEAQGKWKLVSCVSLLEGIGTVAAAALGGVYGGLLEISLAVAILKIVAGIFQLSVAIHVLSGSFLSLIRPVVGAYFVVTVALTPFIVIEYFQFVIFDNPSQYFNVGFYLSSYVLISLFFFPLFCRKGWNELVNIAILKKGKN